MLVRKIFFDYAYVSRENFFDLPPVDNIFGKNLYDLVKILGNVGQNMTTPPPMFGWLRDVPGHDFKHDCCIAEAVE